MKTKITDALSFLGKTVTAKIDRQLGSKHPKWGFEYGVNYGFVPETNSIDGEELDVYVLGVAEPVQEFTGQCIAVIRREGDEDKLVLAPHGKCFSDEEIRRATDFQEKFFKSKIIR